MAGVARPAALTAIARGWGRLTPVGKVVLRLLVLIVVAATATFLLAVAVGPSAVDILAANLPVVR